MACCKQCPTAPATTTPSALMMTNNKDTLVGEEAQARGEVDILSSGGCRFKGDVFENGEEWHPRIQPWGEMRCINCNCKVKPKEKKEEKDIKLLVEKIDGLISGPERIMLAINEDDCS